VIKSCCVQFNNHHQSSESKQHLYIYGD